MNDQKCLVPKCGNKATHRGLCCKCYQVANRLVRKQITTWKKMQAHKKALASRATGRRLGIAAAWFLSDEKGKKP